MPLLAVGLGEAKTLLVSHGVAGLPVFDWLPLGVNRPTRGAVAVGFLGVGHKVLRVCICKFAFKLFNFSFKVVNLFVLTLYAVRTNVHSDGGHATFESSNFTALTTEAVSAGVTVDLEVEGDCLVEGGHGRKWLAR